MKFSTRFLPVLLLAISSLTIPLLKIAQAQQTASPPAIPNGYVALPGVNKFIANNPQFRARIPETFITSDFNSGERQLLEAAVQGYFGTFTSYSPSMDCIMKAAKSLEAKSNWFNAWPDRFKPSPLESLKGVIQSPGIAVYRYQDRNVLRRTAVPMRLFIKRASKPNESWSGDAPVGTDIRNEGYRIRLNMANFSFVPGGNGNTESGTKIARQNTDTSKKMGAVIFHEVLHNVGYDHNDVKNGDFNPVEGSVPYVAQWCFVSFGKHGSAKTLIADGGSWLTDSSSRTDPALYAD
jgi:hypothetical protein